MKRCIKKMEMEIDPSLLTVVLYVVSTSVGAAIWVAKLSTRVAVLEAAHSSMADMLKEIKNDVKELVNALHESVLNRNNKPARNKKP